MAEPELYTFTHKELVEVLIKSQNIREGIWQLYVNFGLKAANLGSSDSDILPTAVIPILQIGLKKADKETNIGVDAAKLYQKPSKASAKK
jgi:hypothetical protein